MAEMISLRGAVISTSFRRVCDGFLNCIKWLILSACALKRRRPSGGEIKLGEDGDEIFMLIPVEASGRRQF